MSGTIDELAVFVSVARLASISHAARELALPKSTVSRKLAALEQRLGITLVERTTRRLRLTEAGEELFEDARRILGELREAEDRVTARRAEPSGLLRITAPVEFGTVLLAPLVASYTESYPRVEIDVVLTERLVDIVAEGFDLAIRAGTLGDTRLAARFLGTTQRLLCASPRYLARNGAPQSPADLLKHATLVFRLGSNAGTWILDGKAGRDSLHPSPRLSGNNYGLLKQAALDGVGVALLPAFDCQQELAEGRLVALLPDWCSTEIPLHALFPSSRRREAKLRTFVDGLVARMSELSWAQGERVSSR